MRILLVDDDRELIDLLAFALKRAGLEPIPAHDAARPCACSKSAARTWSCSTSTWAPRAAWTC